MSLATSAMSTPSPRGVDSFVSLPTELPVYSGPSDFLAEDPDEKLLEGVRFYTKKILVPGVAPYRIAAQLISLSPITDDCLWNKAGGAKPPANLIFCHATGIPKLSYAPALKRLLVKAGPSRLAVAITLDARNAGDSLLNNPPFADQPLNWVDAAKDIVSVVNNLGLDPLHSGRPLIGAGHSHGGGLLLLGSLIQPGLLSAYFAVEPISVSPYTANKMAELKKSGKKVEGRVDLAEGARRRKEFFPSKMAAFDAQKEKAFFKTWAREAAWSYFDDGLCDDGKGGVRLKTAPVQEACTFEGSATTSWGFTRLNQIKIPRVVIISGEKSEQLYFLEPGPEPPSPAWWKIDPKHAKHYEGTVQPDGVRLMTKDIAIARYIPGAHHEILPGGGHMYWQEQPWISGGFAWHNARFTIVDSDSFSSP